MQRTHKRNTIILLVTLDFFMAGKSPTFVFFIVKVTSSLKSYYLEDYTIYHCWARYIHAYTSLFHERLKCLQAVLTGMTLECLHAYCNWVGVTSPAPQVSASGTAACLILLHFLVYQIEPRSRSSITETNQFQNLVNVYFRINSS
jgi:hypothetical protein